MTSPQRRNVAKPLTEQQIQRSVFQHLKTRAAPGVVAWHTPMGGYRRRTEAAIFAGLGALKGVSDVIAIRPPTGQICALELKAEGGKPTIEQLLFIDRVRAAGGIAGWAIGLDVALHWLEQNGILIGRAT